VVPTMLVRMMSEDDEQVLWNRWECTKEHIGLEQHIVCNMNELINYTNSTQLEESVETETSKANTTDIAWIKQVHHNDFKLEENKICI